MQKERYSVSFVLGGWNCAAGAIGAPRLLAAVRCMRDYGCGGTADGIFACSIQYTEKDFAEVWNVASVYRFYDY